MWLRPVKEADRHFALRLAIYKLEQLVSNGISADDFEKTRAYMKRYFRTFSLTEDRRLGYALDDAFYGQRAPYFDALFSDIDKLTCGDVNAVIKKYLTKDNLVIAMVARDARKFADAISSDAPSPVTYVSQKPQAILDEDKIVSELKLGIPPSAIQIVPVDDIFTK
jgi:zinc protease